MDILARPRVCSDSLYAHTYLRTSRVGQFFDDTHLVDWLWNYFYRSFNEGGDFCRKETPSQSRVSLTRADNARVIVVANKLGR
jgi:hypothetical protein